MADIPFAETVSIKARRGKQGLRQRTKIARPHQTSDAVQFGMVRHDAQRRHPSHRGASHRQPLSLQPSLGDNRLAQRGKLPEILLQDRPEALHPPGLVALITRPMLRRIRHDHPEARLGQRHRKVAVDQLRGGKAMIKDDTGQGFIQTLLRAGIQNFTAAEVAHF